MIDDAGLAPHARTLRRKSFAFDDCSEVFVSIQLSAAAAERVHGYLRDKPGSVGLRFGVRRTGCSGWAYVVDITDRIDGTDAVFESHGIKVLVNPDSLPLVAGTEIDFVRQGLNQSFSFRNPNVTNECGCGESFTVS